MIGSGGYEKNIYSEIESQRLFSKESNVGMGTWNWLFENFYIGLLNFLVSCLLSKLVKQK